MSTILVLCVVAAAAWVVMSLVSRPAAGPKDSVEDFARALSALSSQPSPARRPATRRPPARRPAQRPPQGQQRRLARR